MLFIINKKDISFGHNQNTNLHTTLPSAPISRLNTSLLSNSLTQLFLTSLISLMVRFLSKSPVHFTNTGAALSALSAAHKFLCCGLAAQAGHYIVSRLSVNNVLSVLQEVSLHCPKDSGLAPVCSGNKVTKSNTQQLLKVLE